MRTTLPLALITIMLFATVLTGTCYSYVLQNQTNEDSLVTPSVKAEANLTTTLSPSPTANPITTFSSHPSDTSPFPNGYSQFGNIGTFGIVSPTNSTYNSNKISLRVTGAVIIATNIHLNANYSLDGQNSIPIPIDIEGTGMFTGTANGSVTLANLSEGSHKITVFVDLEANKIPHLAQDTVYFNVNSTAS